MSRYRPIAPKPETHSNSSMNDDSILSHKINQSPRLRNLWPQLQARPTRTRKRGRGTLTLPTLSLKRHKTHHHVLGFCSPCHVSSPPPNNLSLHNFASSLSQIPTLPNPNHGGLITTTNNPPSLVTLPLLPCSPPATEPDLVKPPVPTQDFIDLNTKAMMIPEEKDFLQQFQAPILPNVITPKPVRPVGSSICVGCIRQEASLLPQEAQAPKKPEEVEEEVESEILPAVISDSNNKVRMVNSAYKEMVGQPECPWLDLMVTDNGGHSHIQCGSRNRINGDVTLHLTDSNLPVSSNRFSCWVKIEWKTDKNNNSSSVNAFCDVIRLSCESKDYLFTWRFHTRQGPPSESSRNI